MSEHRTESDSFGEVEAPAIGNDKASRIAHHAMERGLTLREAALQLGLVGATRFDPVVDPAKMVRPSVAVAAG